MPNDVRFARTSLHRCVDNLPRRMLCSLSSHRHAFRRYHVSVYVSMFIWIRSLEHLYRKIRKICHAPQIRLPWLSGNVRNSRGKVGLNFRAKAVKASFEQHRALKEDKTETEIRQGDIIPFFDKRLKLIWRSKGQN